MVGKIVSPLHKVIDPGQWDAEGLLGRLIVLVHAAFIDAGFVPQLLLPVRNDGPVPREAGRTASALSLRYTAPQLLRRRNKKTSVAVLRQQVYGRKLVLYVQCAGRPVASSWVVFDAVDAVSLLPGGLDATARALRRDARLAVLWRGLLYGLCRHALVDLCRRNGVALEPTFMSLPDDAKAAILARLADGADLAQVERTCTAVRRLVADRNRVLWKPLYDAEIGRSFWFSDVVQESPEMSWKQRYLRARRTRVLSWWPSWLPWLHPIRPVRIRPLLSYSDSLAHLLGLLDHDDEPADPITRPRKWAKAPRGRRGDDRRGLQGEQRRHGAGAIHAPSSRYRWKHR